MNQTQALERKLLSRRRVEGDCWIWTGSKGGGRGSNYQDYGVTRVGVNGPLRYVHRISAVLWLGYNPRSGLQINHRCNNGLCFNPQHLYIGTQFHNMMDRDRRKIMALPKTVRLETLLKPRYVAEMAGVSPRTVVRWITEGRLRGHKVGRVWRVKAGDWQDFMDENL